MNICPSQNTVKYFRNLAFTMVELLVTIAVIVILAGVSIPVSMSFLERSRETICASNMRQLGIIIRNYTYEHDGYLASATGGSNTTSWWHALGKESDFEGFNELFTCPSNKYPTTAKVTLSDGTKKTITFTYRYSQRLGRGTSTGTWLFPKVKFNLMKNATAVPLLVERNNNDDADAASTLGTWNTAENNRMIKMHGNISNVLFVDGHVAKITQIPKAAKGVWEWDPTY